MKISVLLPTHDSPQTLRESLVSLLAQSHQDLEILVVGDGASDATKSFMAGIDDRRIRWFDLPKGTGFGYANRNIALREASGDLIAYASDDDIMFPTHLESLARQFDRAQAQWAYCRPLWVTGGGIVLPAYLNLTLFEARTRFMERENLLPMGCVMHRRSCLDEAGWWPEDSHKGGDWELWQTILEYYGPGAIGFARVPTHMHFRAGWREELGDWWPFRLAQLNAIAQVSKSWPASLRIEPEEGEIFQTCVMRRLREDTQYPARINYGCTVLQDHLAWTASLNSALV